MHVTRKPECNTAQPNMGILHPRANTEGGVEHVVKLNTVGGMEVKHSLIPYIRTYVHTYLCTHVLQVHTVCICIHYVVVLKFAELKLPPLTDTQPHFC